MSGFVRGRLRDASDAPPTGELVEQVHAFGAAVVEQILSGRLEAPADYLQEQDEWVVVLAGAATPWRWAARRSSWPRASGCSCRRGCRTGSCAPSPERSGSHSTCTHPRG